MNRQSDALRTFENRTAYVLEVIGARLGADWLLYNPLKMHLYHLWAQDNAGPFVDGITDIFPDASTFVDVGCGSGAYAAELNSRGFVAIGCERSPTGRFMARRQGVDVRPFDLAAEIPTTIASQFDVAYCIEVAEHLPAHLGDRLVELVCGLAPAVMFTAAHPGQGGTGHINEQPMEYWETRFGRCGFSRSDDKTDRLLASFADRGVQAHWLLTNAVVFERTAH